MVLDVSAFPTFRYIHTIRAGLAVQDMMNGLRLTLRGSVGIQIFWIEMPEDLLHGWINQHCGHPRLSYLSHPSYFQKYQKGSGFP